MSPIEGLPKEWVEKYAIKVLGTLQYYHRYRAYGLENIPRSGKLILCTNHSLATYDGFLLGLEIYRKLQRHPVGLGDDLLFKIPFLRQIARDIGLFPASPQQGIELLKQGQLLSVAPGGMREGLRSIKNRYQTLWQKRKGFIRLAIRAQAPIVLAACPKADNIYTVYNNPITPWIYEKLKCPLPLARGLGLSLLPRPVKLWHLVSELLWPPKYEPQTLEDSPGRPKEEQNKHFNELVDSFHKEVVDRMDRLMTAALEVNPSKRL